jgi:hypothetical protein
MTADPGTDIFDGRATGYRSWVHDVDPEQLTEHRAYMAYLESIEPEEPTMQSPRPDHNSDDPAEVERALRLAAAEVLIERAEVIRVHAEAEAQTDYISTHLGF